MSLNVYLDAAHRDGRATFSPAQCLDAEEMDGYAPDKLLIVTTGSQAEPRAMLSRAAFNSAANLKLQPTDLLMYRRVQTTGMRRVLWRVSGASEGGQGLR